MQKIFMYLWVLLLTPLVSSAQEAFKITHGPYLQGLRDSTVTMVWTTNKKAISWVELAPDDSTHFYLKERPKHFAAKDGFKLSSMVHSVKINGLKPGVKYRYRVYSQEVTSHVGTQVEYGKVAASAVYKKQPLSFRTSILKDEITFGIINDIHGRNQVMENLLGQLKWGKTDMVFFNGDMADDLRSEQQMFTDYMDTGVKVFASETPMYYARGNHETRGNFASQFSDYFPTPTGDLYFMFRQGPVCFVVLDTGEDKPDSDIEYSGIVSFDDYRTRQAKWLKKALDSKEYKDAPYKVVICHIPPFGGWHGEKENMEKFVPLLNAAKAHVMLNAHLHRNLKKEVDPGKVEFPILVNSNNTVIRATADRQQLKIEVVDQQGKVVDTMVIQPDK
jgi:predicted phosphohydrolase